MKRLLLSSLLFAACSDTASPLPPGDASSSSSPDGGVAADAALALEDASPTPDAAEPDDAGLADTGLGEPIPAAAPNTWVWVDFPGARCDDGSSTGIGVSWSGTSDAVLVFLNGGGSCWDYQTCWQLNTAAHGPFGRAQFELLAPNLDVGIYDRASPQNPFRDYNYVFVPYCTGDLHAGTNDAVYTGPQGQTRPTHHVGHTNVLEYLRRLGPTFPNPSKVVLSGASAGGYGALFNYPAVREVWPRAKAYAIDDSGPMLPGSLTLPATRTAWNEAWHADRILVPLCGDACVEDFSLVYEALSGRYPQDRFSLSSSMRDATIRAYFQLSAPAFEQAIQTIARDAIGPLPNFAYFLVGGETHTMLGAPQLFVAQGATYYDFLRAQVEDDPRWTSVGP